MTFPPLRVGLTASLLIAGGLTALWRFEPRSAPFGVIIPLALCGVMMAAGAGMLLRRKWGRLLAVALGWMFLVNILLWGGMTLARVLAGTGSFTAKNVTGVAVGLTIALTFLMVLRSRRVREWTGAAPSLDSAPQTVGEAR